MSMSISDILAEFESGLAEGRWNGCEDYFAALGDANRKESVAVDLARAELSLTGWPKKRLIEILNFVSELGCLLYTSPSPRDRQKSRMPSSA